MSSKTLRISDELFQDAEEQTKITKRSTAKQIEFWAELGRFAELNLTPRDVEAIFQRKVEVVVKLIESRSVDMPSVFNKLEQDRANSTLVSKVVTSKEWFETSEEHPGFLVKINERGERKIGKFESGKFKVYPDGKKKKKMG